MCWEVWFGDEPVDSAMGLAAKVGRGNVVDGDGKPFDGFEAHDDFCLCPVDVVASCARAGIVAEPAGGDHPFAMAGDYVVNA